MATCATTRMVLLRLRAEFCADADRSVAAAVVLRSVSAGAAAQATVIAHATATR